MLKHVKVMRPADIKPYTSIPPQQIREGMKAGVLNIGFVTNRTGKRYSYNIIPSRFFEYIGQPVPAEWQ